MPRRIRNQHAPLRAALTPLLGALLFATNAVAGDSPTTTEDPASPSALLRDAGASYESASLLPAAARLAALEEIGRSVTSVLDRDLSDGERAAARFLSGEIRYGLGDYKAAAEEYRRAAKGEGKGAFADDAAFRAIEAVEAGGRDAEAAKQWLEWEKRYPESPLLGEARLAQAWNALRRGENAAAERTLSALVAAQPWYETDARVVLARATSLHATGRGGEALGILGTKPTGAAAVYLQALCHLDQGSLLKAAAAFQEVATRYPDSPLRDAALLAKADAFLRARDAKSAAEEFGRAARDARDDGVRAEAELRQAGSLFVTGAVDSALPLLRGVAARYPETSIGARAQFLVGEALIAQGRSAEAIVELNQVLTTYFEHSVAASAQYRIGRCLDALDRPADATGTYQAVVSGYPLEPEAPPAAYLAGVGLLEQGRPRAAAPYFQLVLDRYASRADSVDRLTFATPDLKELVEAALCLLELSYHRAGDLGQVAGAPHLLLQRMPPSKSIWRAYALLIDADASAAMGRYAEAEATLQALSREFPDHPIGASSTKLLAWTYARQGRDSLAIVEEERLVTRFGASGDSTVVSGAALDVAHNRFNQKRYADAAKAYESFLRRYPWHANRLLALYQAGLCYVRMNRSGDAVDRWEAIVRDSASAPIAEKAWTRAGDLYFQAERYEDAKRCYAGLLEHFAATDGAAIATLRLAQCDYNAGRDADALAGFTATVEKFPGTPAAREAARGTELALYRLGQTAEGTEVLSRLVEQYPSSGFAADAQFQIAKRHYSEKHYADAAEAFRRVVSQFPGYSAADQAQFLLADSYARAGSTEEARLAYEQLLSFFPDSPLGPNVEFQLGLIRFQAKEYAGAAVAFTRVLEESVTVEVGSAARYNLALCQRLLGQPDEARATLEQHRATLPGDGRAAEVAYQLGDLHETAGRLAEAAAEYEAALDARPAAALEVEVHYRLGRCRETLGDMDAALRSYQRAAASTEKKNAFRLSALSRCAAIYESKREITRALGAYRDIAENSEDEEVAVTAARRASQLDPSGRKR
jgi:TolA-binding protein